MKKHTKKAAGCIFATVDTKRILMNLRSNEVPHPNSWGFWGGKIENGESILQGLSREVREELGFIPEYIKVLPLDIHKTYYNDFCFYSFVVIVQEEFIPKINSESGGWGWFNLDCLPAKMHPGSRQVIEKQNFDRVFEQILNNL